jgi:hypothetical protein
MTIFKVWQDENAPHINCRLILRRLNYMRDASDRIMDDVYKSADGAQVRKLRSQYIALKRKLMTEVASYDEAIERLGETLLLLGLDSAWNRGYEAAEQDAATVEE